MHVSRELCMSKLKDILDCYCFMFYWTKNTLSVINSAACITFQRFQHSVAGMSASTSKVFTKQVWELNMNEQVLAVAGDL